MELRDIEYFAVVAEHGNVRRASEALGLSPPALSKSLRRLERSLEARVVERTARGVALTAVGRALLARVTGLRLALRDVAREAQDLSKGRSGEVRVAANPVDCENLAAACIALLAPAPNLRVRIIVTDIDVSLPMLRKGELDLAIVVAPERTPAGLTSERLYDDEYVAYCSSRHRLARRRKLALRDLAAERWVLSEPPVRPHQLLAKSFEQHALAAPRVALETRAQAMKVAIVEQSGLLGFGSRRSIDASIARGGVKVLPATELVHPRPVCAIYRSDAYLPAAARAFIDALKASQPKARRAKPQER